MSIFQLYMSILDPLLSLEVGISVSVKENLPSVNQRCATGEGFSFTRSWRMLILIWKMFKMSIFQTELLNFITTII